jgi:hypothetical protein
MTDKRIALILAGLFACGWLAILYAGADHPPPPGFAWIVLMVTVAGLLVYVRVPSYIRWHRNRKRLRLLLTLADGLAAGLAFAGLAMLFPGGGEPSVQPRIVDRAIWFAVLGAVGLVNAGLVYLASVLLTGRPGRTE